MNRRQKISCLAAVLRANVLGHRRPISCQYAITNRCPWRCRYCNVENAARRELSTDEAIRVVDGLAGAGGVRLHLVGGEPMMRDDLGEIIGYAKRRGLYVTMATSGIRIPELYEQVRETDLFLMSFDGPEEVHDQLRNRGSYRVLREAMECLKKNGKEFWTTTVLTRANIGRLDFVLDTAAGEGFTCNFHLLYTSPEKRPVPGYLHPHSPEASLAATGDEYREALGYLLERKRTDLRSAIGDSVPYLQALLDWGDLSETYRSRRAGRYSCWAGKLFAYVDSNGDLYPCCDVIGRVPPRNVLEAGFRGAFDSLPDPPCRSCTVACYVEMNLMFSLNPGAIRNWVGKV